MKIKSLFKPKIYINKIKTFKKRLTVSKLIKEEFSTVDLGKIWKIDDNIKAKNLINDISEYKIFGTPIDLNNVNWHKDYVSGFEYPKKRFDKIKISKWFNKGIDVKFPWEVSRFYFAIKLSQNYLATNKTNNYEHFKNLFLDWIEKNPFCYGVNWVCTMEVAIRAINWIVAINIFDDVFQKDEDFKEIISKSLIQHAEYISEFPEIYENGHTSNHATADYAGLLFLALTLKGYPKSKEWLKQSIEGLEQCIRYQTYEDGVNFEASIPYHRLVLEMFAYSAIVAKANNIEFSNKYYELLFKMFEYSAAYMDHNGNAPQVGDNDSGRILIFHASDEHDHSYLLDLGEHIFDYKFKSQCKKRNPDFKQWLPEIEKINVKELNVTPRETDKSIEFENGGAYFLKNENFSLMVSCFPIGQNGKGGHNHYDVGSFTLSVKGVPVIVDPGTYAYTRSRKDRDKFRNLFSHNIIYKQDDKDISLLDERTWFLKQYFKYELIDLKDNILEIKIYNLINDYKYTRRFELLENNILKISDICRGEYVTILHFAPNINIKKQNKNTINACNIIIKSANENNLFRVKDYLYSSKYDERSKAFMLIGKNNNNNINIFTVC